MCAQLIKKSHLSAFQIIVLSSVVCSLFVSVKFINRCFTLIEYDLANQGKDNTLLERNQNHCMVHLTLLASLAQS